MKHALGIDISTQTITAMLIGVIEVEGRPRELVISSAWTETRACRDGIGRKNPSVWLELVRECISGLQAKARETETAEAIGISTTFPGCFGISRDGLIDPRFVSLYDNTDDSGVCAGEFDTELAEAESCALCRMWPGNMAIGLVALLKAGMRLDDLSKLVPPNSAFAHELLTRAGSRQDPAEIFSDFTETAISGLYDTRTGEPLPPGARSLLSKIVPEACPSELTALLPRTAPAWRNVIPPSAIQSVRELLGLPKLRSASIGAGDSPLGTLALMGDRDTVINVRGSSDSPMIVVDSPKPRDGAREIVLHYPLPTATSMNDSPWCVVAPMLRSGRVWDWVRSLRFPAGDGEADAKLEALALESYRDTARSRLRFDTALGGERAPFWDSRATGSLTGLIEDHGIGDIALAALEGMSRTLGECIRLMERRYGVETSRLLLVGGPARNRLWNWITQEITGKKTYATTFSDASLLGAALLGYAAAYDGLEPDAAISKRLMMLSKLSSSHPLIAPVAVERPY